MKQYSFIHAFAYCFFSKEFYRDVGHNWRGLSLRFLFLTLAISWLPMTYELHVALKSVGNELVPYFTKQLPEVHIRDGELSISAKEPVYIQDDENIIAVIDPFKEYADEQVIKTLRDNPALILIATKQHVFIRKDESSKEIRAFSYEKVSNVSFTPSKIDKIAADWARFAGWLLWPVLILGSFIYRLIQLLLYSAIGMLFAELFSVDIKFSEVMRLAVMAITPSILLSTFLPMGLGIWCGYFVLSMVYLALAIRWQLDDE